MSYTKYHDPWADADSATGGGDESTPLIAAALDHIETGIFDAAADIDSLTAEVESITADLLTKIAQAIVDAKGDLIVASAADVVARLAVGSNGQVLTADSTETLGMKWAAAAGGSITSVTALPSSPADGDEIIFTDSLTAPTYRWHLRYNSGSSSSYKWEFIGGTPALVMVTTDEASPGASYADLTTVGPSFTTPLAGDYVVTISAQVYTTTGGGTLSMSYAVGGTGASDTWAAHSQNVGTGTGQIQLRTYPQSGLAASTLIRAKYKGANGSAQHWVGRLLEVRPVRVS